MEDSRARSARSSTLKDPQMREIPADEVLGLRVREEAWDSWEAPGPILPPLFRICGNPPHLRITLLPLTPGLFNRGCHGGRRSTPRK